MAFEKENNMFYLLKSYLWYLLNPIYEKIYSIKIAQTKEEKEKIFKFRYEVYRLELEHGFIDNFAKNNMLFDDLDFSDNTIIFYAGDIDHILGSFRLTVWNKELLPLPVKEKYYIEDDLLKNVDRIGEIRFFQIRKSHRRSMLAATLLSNVWKLPAENPAFYTDLIFADCQPGLLMYYLNIGGFIYTDKVIYKEFGILQIPFAVAIFDKKYLLKIKSPFYILSKKYFKKYLRKYPVHLTKTKIDEVSLIPHQKIYMDYKEIIKYQNNFSDPKALAHFNFITRLIRPLLVLQIEANTAIIKKEVIDFDLFILLEGTVGIFVGEVLITQLSQGALFGEMALMDPNHKRSADVIAISPVKILLISRNYLSSMLKKNPRIAFKFQEIVCESLFEKLQHASQMIIELKNTKS